ncbi:MAG: hypothetical protein GY719_42830 [bacterium]|nr:hypothetical protein [bacterium]
MWTPRTSGSSRAPVSSGGASPRTTRAPSISPSRRPAAVIGEVEESGEILAVEAGTDGSRADVLCLEAGGTRQPFNLEAAQAGLHENIVMHGREVFKNAVARMSAAARQVLATAGRELGSVAMVVPHQANLRIVRAVARALDTPMERVFVNLQEYGNTGSASIPLALSQAREQGRIREGDLVLLTSFGAGFHWAAALVQF